MDDNNNDVDEVDELDDEDVDDAVGDVRGSGNALTARRKCPSSSVGSSTFAGPEREGGEGEVGECNGRVR